MQDALWVEDSLIERMTIPEQLAGYARLIDMRPPRTLSCSGLRVDVRETFPSFAALPLCVNLQHAVQAGQKSVVTLWIRAAALPANLDEVHGLIYTGDGAQTTGKHEGEAKEIDSSTPMTTLDAGDPSLRRRICAGREWHHYSFAFQWREDLAAGSAALCLGFSRLVQTVDIAGLSINTYPPDFTGIPLSYTPISYPGRERDAEWRADAEERITQHRMGAFRVKVVDARGHPVQGVRVQLTQKKHAFDWGTQVQCETVHGNELDDAHYRDVLLRLFNSASLANALKWRALIFRQNRAGDGRYAQATVEQCLDWLSSRGFDLRGHSLIQPGWETMPDYVRDQRENLDGVERACVQHIDDLLNFSRTYIKDWDVVSDLNLHHDVLDALGSEALVTWFQRAKAAMPDGTFWIADHGILSDGGINWQAQDRLSSWITLLLEHGVAIEGLTLQAHFRVLTPPERIGALLNRYASLGIKLRLGAVGVDTTDETLQADYLRDVLTMAFAHPAMTGIQLSGFWEGASATPRAALYRQDWTPKAAAQAFNDLVYNQWWTKIAGPTNVDGLFTGKGYFGEYCVKARRGSHQVMKTLDLTPDTDTWTVEFIE